MARAATARVLLPLALLALAACSSRDSELDQFIEATKSEPGGRVEPIPELKPYDTTVYNGTGKRSPFLPGGSGAGSNPQVRPVTNRNREFLEQFSLDTLKMVGTIKLNGVTYGLLRVADGRVHRVKPGNYIGQNDGKISRIESNRVYVTEVVPDGLGGYMERPAEIALSE